MTDALNRLSEAARQFLERYLWELRLSLQGCASVNAADVEAEVRQHINQELLSGRIWCRLERGGALPSVAGSDVAGAASRK